MSLSPIIPLGQQELGLHFVQLFSVLNKRDTQKNTDIFRVTNKQYNTFLKNFIERKWHFQRVTAKYFILFPEKLYQTILLSLSDVNSL